MRIVLIGFLTMASAANAASLDGASITESAVRCWNLPPTTDLTGFDTAFLVKLVDGRVTEITVTDYQPVTDAGRSIVRSASLAIERCAPYSSDDGEYSVRFSERSKNIAPLDPFETQHKR